MRWGTRWYGLLKQPLPETKKLNGIRLTIRDRDLPKLKDRAETRREHHDSCNLEPVQQPAELYPTIAPPQENLKDKSRWRNNTNKTMGKEQMQYSNQNQTYTNQNSFSNQRQNNQPWSGQHPPTNPPHLNVPPYPQYPPIQDQRDYRGPAIRGPANQWVPNNQNNQQHTERRRSRSRSASVEVRNYEPNDGRETDLTVPSFRDNETERKQHLSTGDGK